MERNGFKIDLMHLKEIELEATRDKDMYETEFLEWVYSTQEDAKEFNPSSTQQMQQLLFAPFNKTKKAKKSFSVDDEDFKTEAWDFPQVRNFRVENLSGYIKEGRAQPLKYRDMEVRGLGLPVVDKTDGGLP